MESYGPSKQKRSKTRGSNRIKKEEANYYHPLQPLHTLFKREKCVKRKRKMFHNVRIN